MLRDPTQADNHYAREKREERITEGLEMVERLARRMARRLPPHVELDDLVGAGTVGLIQAVDNYDPTRGTRFQAYAERRIRGAILDELRRYDVMTQYGRRKMVEVSRTIRELETRLGRAPEEQEIAGELEISLSAYRKLALELSRAPALGRLGVVDPDDVDSGTDDPLSIYEERERRERVAEAITELPERTQMVLALYYQEQCTQAEIGELLSVTESRVCQILGEAAARIRARLSRGHARGLRRRTVRGAA